MRVEPAARVYRNEDRRQRFEQRRGQSQDRRDLSDRRARHVAHVWFQPAFGAHILGQIAPATPIAAQIARAYAQPEARTPLRPDHSASA